ncbi:MAG: exosortase B [Azoarcus sp.]|nr:exosortase B [Azoarcus sp.]
MTTFAMRAQLPWLVVLAGLLFLYTPMVVDFATGIWRTEEQFHGPLVLGIAIWLIMRKWSAFSQVEHDQPLSILGWPLFVGGCLMYVLGRSQGIDGAQAFSLIPVLIGTILLLRGPHSLKVIWFPVFFLFFLVPLPGPLVDALTMPMKIAVSYVAESTLFALGYPIARAGVIIQIGQYQLLVADACAGLQTLLALESLGLLYLNVVSHTSLLRNITLAILIVPISFAANVIRVIVLTLVTYHFGDAAGQGFLHGFAGMVLFVSALLIIIAVDALLRLIVARRASASGVRA